MRRYATLTVVGLLASAACMDQPTSPATRTGNPAAAVAVTNNSTTWAQQIVGETGPGSTYGLFLPVNWNGDAIFYAHGVRDIAEPVNLPIGDSTEFVRDALGAMGYAVAYSSWSSNGYDFDDGVRRTYQLRGLFISKFGQPHRSYLVGHSLGSEIAEAIAEKYPNQFDGAFLMCGVLGGSLFEFQYIGNVRLLFDYFYPGVLPGSVDAMPSNVTPTQIQNAAVAAIVPAYGGDPTGASIMMQIDTVPIPGNGFNEKVQALVYALVAHSRFVNDLLSRVHNHFPYSNDGITYSSSNPALSGPLALLNATIPRYTLTADARAWLDHNFEPSGAIRFPVLTMHTTRDPLVIFQHDSVFANTVANAGASAFLAQQPIDAYGHCAFSVAQMLDGFNALVNWVVNDVHP